MDSLEGLVFEKIFFFGDRNFIFGDRNFIFGDK